jgi:hypothetical protein
MKIYKFRDLTDEKKHSHFYQIVLQNSIWCAKPDSLNDENEFKFKLDCIPSADTAKLLSQLVEECNNRKYHPNLFTSPTLNHKKLEDIAAPIFDDLIKKCRNAIGVASFSITKTDNNLWNEYGGKGNGVCIEINIPDELIGKSYHRVHYVSEKILHIDTILKSYLFQERYFETYQNILLTKTKKWSQEEEIRFISKHQEVNLNIDGYISEVSFGAQVPAHILEQVEANIVKHCNTNNIRITKL